MIIYSNIVLLISVVIWNGSVSFSFPTRSAETPTFRIWRRSPCNNTHQSIDRIGMKGLLPCPCSLDTLNPLKDFSTLFSLWRVSILVLNDVPYWILCTIHKGLNIWRGKGLLMKKGRNEVPVGFHIRPDWYSTPPVIHWSGWGSCLFWRDLTIRNSMMEFFEDLCFFAISETRLYTDSSR